MPHERPIASTSVQSAIATHIARRMWHVLEPYHAMIYFAPEAREAYTAAGLKGYWMGYFASRSAALGPVSANVVAAVFYNFHPRMVARAIPDARRFSSPEAVLAARYGAADAALRRLLGEAVSSPEVAEAATLARKAVEGCDVAGRPLFAAHLSLPWPEAPHLALWHATTLLREYRGDGHVAALLAERLDGCEAHVSLVETGAVPREAIQPHRGWTDEEWDAAAARLRERGWLDESGMLTERGAAVRLAVEQRTNRLAEPPWQHLGDAGCERLHALVWPLSDALVRAGGLPVPNPLGLSWP
jgi:helix-turn-helix protein